MSLEQLEDLFQKFYSQRELKEQLERELKEINFTLSELEGKILEGLEVAGKSNWELPEAKFHITERSSFSNPKDPDRVSEFRKYLFDQGLEDMLTVHSQKLNSWANQEFENAKVRGDVHFKIPGLELPISTRKITMRRK